MMKFRNIARRVKFRTWVSLSVIVIILPFAIFRVYSIIAAPPVSIMNWPLDDATGSAVQDRTTNDNDGTLTNAVWRNSDYCLFQGCLYFDGSGDFVTRADDADLNFAGAESFTITAWMKHPVIATNPDYLVAKYLSSTGTDGGYKIYMNNDGTVTCGIDNDQTSFPSDTASSTARFDDNNWHHIACVKSGTASLTLYVDAKLIATDSSITSATLLNTDAFYLGIDGDGSSNGWEGFIDELRVYRTALALSDIQVDYNQGALRFAPVANDFLTRGLLGYWPLDELAADTCVGGANDSCNKAGVSGTFDGAWNGNAANSGGKYGPGINLDATNDFINIPDNDNLDIGDNQDFTVSFWANTAAGGADSIGYLFGKQNSGSAAGYRIQLDKTTGQLVFFVSDGTDTYSVATNTGILNNGTWTHIVVVYDDDNIDGTVFYINGATTTNTPSGTLSAVNSMANTEALRFGTNGAGNNDAGGNYDEFRMYNRALSLSEARSLYLWAPGPLAYWKFDEGTGTTSVFDSSGNGNTGTMTGSITATQWGQGKFGQALNFDGTDDGITTSNNNSIKGLTAFTVESWFKVTNVGATDKQIYFESVSNSGGNRATLSVDTGGQLFWGGRPATADSFQTWVNDNRSLTADTWYHVAAIFNSETDVHKLYLNGVVATNSLAQATMENINPNIVPRIGLNNGTGSPMAGPLDEVKVYNYERTAQQVVEDMNGGHPTGGSPIGTATSYWKFDEGTGTTVFDDNTANQNNLTQNTSSWTLSGKFDKAWNGLGTNWNSRADDDDFDFTATDDATINLWFKSDSAANPGALEYLLNKSISGGSQQAGYAVYLKTTGVVCFGIDDDTTWTPDDEACSTADVYDNTWHNVTAVKTQNTRIDIYVDGKPVGADATIAATGTLANNRVFYVGDWNGTDDGDEFNGDIDEVKIFRSAANSDQVKVLFSASSGIDFGSTISQVSQSLGNTFLFSPLAWWKLDENTGTSTVADISGNANDLTMNTIAATAWQNGKVGQALQLDGVNDTLSRADDPDLDVGTTSFTYTFWFKHNGAISATEYLITKADTTNGGYKMYLDASGNACIAIDDDAAWTPDDSACTTGKNYADNAWHFFIGAKLGTSLLEVAIDNDLTSAGIALDAAIAATGTLSNTNTFYIGADRDGTSNVWNGLVDDIKLIAGINGYQSLDEYYHGAATHWWKLDDCTGGTAADNGSSGSLSNGSITIGGSGTNTATGTCTSGTGTHAWNNGNIGKYNNSLDFDGTDDFVDLGTLNDLEAAQGFAISLWMKPGTVGVSKGIIVKANIATQYSVMIITDGTTASTLNVYIPTGGSDAGTYGSIPNALTAGVWTHLAAVFDGSQGGNTTRLRLYLNGAPANTTYFGTIPATTQTSTANMRLGSVSDGTAGTFYDGQIDDVRVFSTPLSAMQVAKAYNDGAAARFGPVTGPP